MLLSFGPMPALSRWRGIRFATILFVTQLLMGSFVAGPMDSWAGPDHGTQQPTARTWHSGQRTHRGLLSASRGCRHRWDLPARLRAFRSQGPDWLADPRAALWTIGDPITAEELLAHVALLASDEFEGREAGAAGGQRAGDYIASELQLLQLEPCGDDGTFFQSFRDGFRNVLALLSAAETSSDTDIVLIGAHYDHLGIRHRPDEAPRIFPGADDNASGVAAVLELAEAFATCSVRPRRSILFVFWDAEEKGLLGSRHWVNHPTIPIERVRFVINLDMLGRLRDNQLTVFGAGSAPGLRRLMAEHNRETDLEIDFRAKMIRQSDHYPFFQQGIPVLFPWTGMHPQLHRETDKIELINEQGMQSVALLVQHLVWDLANRDELPPFRSAAKSEIERNIRAPATVIQPLPDDLRSPWGFTARSSTAEPDTLIITSVEENSLAATAHLRTGDRIHNVHGTPPRDPEQMPELLSRVAAHCLLEIERHGRFLSVTLQAEAATLNVMGDEPAPHNELNLASHGSGRARMTVRRWNRRPGAPGRRLLPAER